VVYGKSKYLALVAKQLVDVVVLKEVALLVQLPSLQQPPMPALKLYKY
jgi:hypothetical protein